MHDPAATRRRLSAFTLLGEGEVGILFDRQTLDVRPLGAELAAALGGVVESAASLPDDAPDWDELAALVERIDAQPGLDTIASAVPQDAIPRAEGGVGSNRLFKLAVSVADTCNLACTCCYANRGLYERPVGRVMSPEWAQRVVENAIARFDAIETVQFIGGEPSLNLQAVERVCETFSRAVDEGRLSAPPRFVITTNGLRLGPEFLHLARRFDVRPTVSLDGPREVHDRGRVTPDGAGSHDRIRAGIESLRDGGVERRQSARPRRLDGQLVQRAGPAGAGRAVAEPLHLCGRPRSVVHRRRRRRVSVLDVRRRAVVEARELRRARSAPLGLVAGARTLRAGRSRRTSGLPDVFRPESVPRAETTADYLGRPSFGERVFGAALVDG